MIRQKIKFSQKGFAFLGIIVIVLLGAILGGGTYVLVSQKSNPKIEKGSTEEGFSQEEKEPPAPTSQKDKTQPTIRVGKISPSEEKLSQPQKSTIKIFLISLDDQGQYGKLVGCGDSVMGVERTITSTDQPPIKEALNELFLAKDQYAAAGPGYHNALTNSNLKVDNVVINNGQATVYLSGTYSLAGACDNPRFKAQIEETILQFPSIKKASVFINNISLDKILSGQGE